jgi:hypothetical protein
VVEVRIAAQALDVLHGVAGCHTGSKGRGTDIDGVGTMVDGLAALLVVLGRREEF